MENREEGYYWVKIYGVWAPAELSQSVWEVLGESGCKSEEDFDEIGLKIEHPTPKHVCEFKRVKGPSGIEFDYCSCGISIPHILATHEDRMKIGKELLTPGAVFQIVDESEA